MAFPVKFLSLQKPELEYEVGIRGDTPGLTVQELRKQISKLCVLFPSEDILESNLSISVDLKGVNDVLAKIQASLDTRLDRNALLRTQNLLNHLYHRLNRIVCDDTTRPLYDACIKEFQSLTARVGTVKDTAVESVLPPFTTEPPSNASPMTVNVTCDRGSSNEICKIKFDGKTCVRAFVQRMTEFCEARAISDTKILSYATEIFVGDALHWFRSVRDQVSDWDELAILLKQDFGQSDYDYRLLSEIRARSQGESENITIYLSIMAGLFSRLSKSLPEEEKLEIIMHNIRPCYASTLSSVPAITDVNTLRTLCRNYESIQARLADFHEPPRLTSDTLAPEFAYADCLHLQLYRDPKDRFKKGQTKASLSLQQFLGFESGFTLDKESNTIAIICQDVIVVLAFETRERLIAWQVKVGSQLGSSKEWLVMLGSGSRKLPAGPARLHLQGRRFAMTSGVPPRLLGLWELAHLRRYGVVEGRFCFEGGSHCGKGEGLHVLITDQAQDITDGFDAAAHGNPKPPASRKSGGADRNRPDTRLSDLNGGDQSIPDTGLYEQNFFGEDCGEVSPFWPSDERRGFDEHDCKGCDDSATRPPWSGADHVTLERCSNCVTKLGTMTRSSTVALTPGTHFNPAWTMDAVPESSSDNSSNSTEYLTPRAIKKSLEASQCNNWAPQRPPKPARLEEKKPAAALPAQTCLCSNDKNFASNANNPKVGPYENYDVPKTTHVEVDTTNEYYDTPKRIKKALAEDLFQVTKSSAPGNLVLKKNCGCILKFASKKKPVIVEYDENIQPVDCPCQKVTNWANNLISLPYCKRNVNYDKVNTEVLSSQKSENMALYATVDVTRKTNRQSSIAEKDSVQDCNEVNFINYENLDPKGNNDFEDPYANYENLEFALSLEYYENAKDLLKKAGVTQKELDALSANVEFAESVLPTKTKCCAKCGHHSAKYQAIKKNKSDEYLLMEPSKEIKRELCRTVGPNPGYTPMSPNPKWSQSLRHPLQKNHKVDIEKSLSIPTLTGDANQTQSFDISSTSNNNREPIQKRSSSVDSARLLEDLKEFDSSIGSHATSSSLETLRNLAIENRRSLSPCDNGRDCCDHGCCKSSDSENKTSEGSCSKDVPHLRNKHMDNAQIKRSSSVPCKSGGNRDSSSSNDSGVSSCSMKHGPEFSEFEMPLTSGHSRYQYLAHRRMRGNATGCIHSSLPRKSKSSDLRDMSMQIHKTNVPAKSSSAEAEVPVLPPKQFKGVMDTHSTSSGTSDMSDYIETLSLTSSHSSSDNPNIRMIRQPTMTLRPRSGKEYQNLDPIITSMYKSGKELSNYTNIP